MQLVTVNEVLVLVLVLASLVLVLVLVLVGLVLVLACPVLVNITAVSTVLQLGEGGAVISRNAK